VARPQLALYAYNPGDIDGFTPRPDFAAELAAVNWAWPEGPPPGRTWSLFRREPWKILGVGGLVDRGFGRWQAWACLAELSRREWKVAFDLARQVLEAHERFANCARIEASARVGLPGAVQLLDRLGFVPLWAGPDSRIGPDTLYLHLQRTA
jgi:hypothetical protein